jgi:hypothetical protein
MANEYWRIRIKGEAGTPEVAAAASELGGTIVRVHFEKGETRLYVAAPESTTREAKRTSAYGAAERVDQGEAMRPE